MIHPVCAKHTGCAYKESSDFCFLISYVEQDFSAFSEA